MRTVDQLMTPDPVIVSGAATVEVAAGLMADCGFGCLPVCDSAGRLQGLLTRRDIVENCLSAGRNPSETRVREVAGPAAVTVQPDDSVDLVLAMLSDHAQRHAVVVRWHRPVGILTLADLVQGVPVDDVGRLLLDLSDNATGPPSNVRLLDPPEQGTSSRAGRRRRNGSF